MPTVMLAPRRLMTQQRAGLQHSTFPARGSLRNSLQFGGTYRTTRHCVLGCAHWRMIPQDQTKPADWHLLESRNARRYQIRCCAWYIGLTPWAQCPET